MRLLAAPGGRRPAADRVFGSCLIVFVLGRLVARHLFRLDGVAGSVFALGGIFSNNVMLGLPIAGVMLGEAAIPSVALVLVFNGLILWTLVTVSIEWARNGSPTLSGFAKTARSVLTNPLIVGILSGTLFSLTGLPLPAFVDRPISMLGRGGAAVAGGTRHGAGGVPHRRRLAAEQRHLRAETAGAAISDLAAGLDDGSAADGDPGCGAAGLDGGG